MGNEYAYAGNRPLVVGDPLGLQGHVIILASFSGFKGVPSNPSGPFADSVGAELAKAGVPVVRIELKVEWGNSAKALADLIEATKKANPGKCVKIVAVGRGNVGAPEMETLALNARGDIEDTLQQRPGHGSPQLPSENQAKGPPEARANAEAKKMVDGTGIALDDTMTPYICAEIAYLLYWMFPGVGVFVHVPDDVSKSTKAAENLGKKLAGESKADEEYWKSRRQSPVRR